MISEVNTALFTFLLLAATQNKCWQYMFLQTLNMPKHNILKWQSQRFPEVATAGVFLDLTASRVQYHLYDVRLLAVGSFATPP